MPERVRFAPSPTGLLHVGGLRTALFNWLVARQTGGTFVLRIEDTDQGRFVEGAEADILESLAWAGLPPDEGPGSALENGGPHAPYRQSERTALYRDAARRLIDDGRAYVAFDSEAELAAMRERGETYGAATRARMTNVLTLGEDEAARRVAAGEPHVVRLKVEPGQTVAFTDRIRGGVAFETDTVDDAVLLKSDGLPTYHLANVVDDHAMAITLVIRGEEWLPSVPKHLLLYEALGWEPPAMAHLPLILSPSGGKLSKRSAETLGLPVNVRQARETGYEPEALVNFLALLGWNPGTDQERFSLTELAEAFSLDRVGASGSTFDLAKLDWHNGQTLRELDPTDLAERARPAVEARFGPQDAAHLVACAALLRERLAFSKDLADAAYLFEDPQAYDEKGVAKRWTGDAGRLMSAYADRLEADPYVELRPPLAALNDWSVADLEASALEQTLRDLAEAEGVGFGAVVHPARLAVTGVTAGAGLFETMAVVGRAACVRRLRAAAERLG